MNINYKETIASISAHDTPSLMTYSCNKSDFSDPVHGHVVTGDLWNVDVKLRKLLSKRLNYGESGTINYNKCKNFILKSLDHLITLLIERYKLNI